MYENLDDIALIQLTLQGKQTAYAVIVDRYQQYVFTIAMRFLDDRELAEELSQDIFIKAYRYLADFKGNSKFSTWLYTIVNTTCLSHLRKKRVQTMSFDGEKLHQIPDRQLKPSELIEHKTQKNMINEAIKHLPEVDGEIITLFYLAEQTTEEIGLIVGMTPGNVKIRLYRARQKLREIMETKFKFESVRQM